MPSVDVEKYLFQATNVGANIENCVQNSNDSHKCWRAAIYFDGTYIQFTDGGTAETYPQSLLLHVVIF